MLPRIRYHFGGTRAKLYDRYQTKSKVLSCFNAYIENCIIRNSIKLTFINEQIKKNIFKMSKMTINFSNCENFSHFRNNRYIINMPIKLGINAMLLKMTRI